MKIATFAAAILLAASFGGPALADDDELSQEVKDKILKAMEPLGCTEIKGEGEDEGTHYEVDDIVCQGRSYDIQIDKDMRIITMMRDPIKNEPLVR